MVAVVAATAALTVAALMMIMYCFRLVFDDYDLMVSSLIPLLMPSLAFLTVILAPPLMVPSTYTLFCPASPPQKMMIQIWLLPAIVQALLLLLFSLK